MFNNDGDYNKEIINAFFEMWCEDFSKDPNEYHHLSDEFLDFVWDKTYSITYKDERKGKKVRNFLETNKKLKEERGRHSDFAGRCLLKTLCNLIDRIERKESYGGYYNG